MRLRTIWVAILTMFGCVPKFVDTTTSGVPNMDQIAPDLWRMGQPADAAAWAYVKARVQKPGKRVLDIKLNDDVEGSDAPAEAFTDWVVDKTPIPPEDDKIWSVFIKPDPSEVTSIVKLIIKAHNAGWVVLFHCTHGRDRTSLISALTGMKLFGWTKQQAWDDMLAHGFRFELPDLLAYWIEDVDAKTLPK